MSKNREIEMVPVDKIMPDADQPRRDFNASKLNYLRDSVLKHGILNPLKVEKVGDKFLLVDGERRYRVAKLLKLSTVPAIVGEAKDAAKRLIEQFQLQEQHEGWSAVEKAIAVGRLAKLLGLKEKALCESLSLPERTISDYLAFYALVARDHFVKNEIPIGLAPAVKSIRLLAKRDYETANKKEFTVEQQKKFEQAVIVGIASGRIEGLKGIAKLKDSIKTDVKTIDKIIEGKASADSLFMGSKAQAAHYFRNMVNNCNYLSSAIERGLGSGFESYFEGNDDAKKRVRMVIRSLDKLKGVIAKD